MEKTGLKLTDMTDFQVIEAALGKDTALSQAAFYVLYSRYSKGVKNHISRYISDATEVEDICMETFAKAFKQLSTYSTENKFATWIFRIARNTAFDHLSHEKASIRKAVHLTIDYSALEHIDLPSDDQGPEDEVIGGQDHEQFLASVAALPDLYREAATLCFVENLGYKEIAARTGLPINTVKTRISRARTMITRKLAELEDE